MKTFCLAPFTARKYISTSLHSSVPPKASPEDRLPCLPVSGWVPPPGNRQEPGGEGTFGSLPASTHFCKSRISSTVAATRQPSRGGPESQRVLTMQEPLFCGFILHGSSCLPPPTVWKQATLLMRGWVAESPALYPSAHISHPTSSHHVAIYLTSSLRRVSTVRYSEIILIIMSAQFLLQSGVIIFAVHYYCC